MDWLALLQHFATMSLLSVGGALATAPEMYRYLVSTRGWLSDAQFTGSIALAQAAPGPNILFVALLGWTVGLNAAGDDVATSLWWSGIAGMAIAMIGIVVPSSVFAYVAGQWAHRHRSRIGVQAFKMGMGPIVVALMLSTVWLLTSVHDDPGRDWTLWALTGASALVIWRTKTHLLWLILIGGILGAVGWV